MTQPGNDTAIPPRVLEVLYSFRVGGSEIVALELAAQLARRGAHVMCAALDETPGPLIDRCKELGLQIVFLGIAQRNILGRNGLSIALVRRLQALRLDAIHLHHFLALNKLGIAARLAGIKRIVVTEHSDAQIRASSSGSFRLRLNWRLAHVITVIHEGLRRYLVDEIGIPDSRIETIRNGIDVTHWQRGDRDECRKALELGQAFTFVFVGRVAAVKDVPGLIVAFLAARPNLPSLVRLLIVGDGPEMQTCKELVRDHPFGQLIVFTGEQHDVRRYLAAADAFVLNSRSEGSPRSLLEAMAMSIPAICPRVGEVPQLLGGGRGWLTVAGAPQSLIDALIEVAANPGAAQDVADRAKTYVLDQYDSRNTIAHYESLLCRGRGN